MTPYTCVVYPLKFGIFREVRNYEKFSGNHVACPCQVI